MENKINEDDRCSKCKTGILYLPPVENCSCHINPPCSACIDRLLICNNCEFEEEEE